MLGRLVVLRCHSGPQIPFKITAHFMAVRYYIAHRVLQKKVCIYVCMYVFVYDFKATIRNFQSAYYYDRNGVSSGPFLKWAKMHLFVSV